MKFEKIGTYFLDISSFFLHLEYDLGNRLTPMSIVEWVAIE